MRALAVFAVLLLVAPAFAEKDPKACEVCIKVINDIKEASKGLTDLEAIEGKLQTVCSKVTDVKDKKLCYYIEPIQREVSRPVANGLPADRICQKLKKSSSEICSVVYSAGEAAVPVDKQDLNKMTVKQLRQVLARRGVSCDGCIEKADFVKRVEETKDVKEKEL